MNYSRSDFSAGEISPTIGGRIELDQYKTGCKSLKNMIPLPTGGVINRPGTEFIAAVKAVGTKWVVRGFTFSATDTFVLELGEYYMRFIKDGVQVTSGGSPYEIVTPWLSIHVADLKFTQSADQIWISHPSYPTKILTRYADTNWTLTNYDYTNGPFLLENSTTTTITAAATAVNAAKVITGVTKANPGVVTSAGHGYADGDIIYIEGIVGMTELNNLPFKVRNKGTDTFELDYNGAGASLNTAGYTAYVSGGTAKKTTVFTASTSIFSNVTSAKHGVDRTLWELRHWIESQKVWTAHTGNTSSTSIKCGGTWRLTTHGVWYGNLAVEVSDDGGTTWTKTRFYASNNDKNYDSSGTETFSEQFLVRTTMTEFSAGQCVAWLSTDPFEWVGVAHVVQVPSGGGGTSTNYTTADVVVEKTIGLATASTVWSEGAWSQKRGYPYCSSFFNDRLCFAGPNPGTIYMSKTGNYYDYGRSFPLVDDDGITIDVNSRELNQIYNMVDINRLAEFTGGGVFSTEAGSDGVLAPTAIINKSHDLAGASRITPAIINDRAVYFQAFNRILRDTAYNMETEGFTGINLSLFSDHIFDTSAAVEMAYQRNPWQTLWIVRADGKLISLTYTKQAEIYGWAVHSTNRGLGIDKYTDDENMSLGKFESVCCIPGTSQDDVYVVVMVIGPFGGEYRFIERMSNRNSTTDPDKQVFLDGSFTVNNPKTIFRIESWPIQISSTAHGFSDGDVVEFSKIENDSQGGLFRQLNGGRYTVANKTDDTFELSDAVEADFPAVMISTLYGEVRKTFAGVTMPTALLGQTLYGFVNGYPCGAINSSTGAFPSSIIGSVAVIGRPYYAECEPTPIDFETTAGSTQMKTKSISNAAVRLYETYGGKIGTDRAHMYAMTDNDGGVLHHVLTAGQPTGTPPALFTGMYKQTVVSGSGLDLSLIIRQEDPYPMTILNINADVEVET